MSKRGLFERAAKFADTKSALQVWFGTAVEAEWRNIEDVRKSFPATDMKGDLAIFNIHGDNYRLIVRMVFQYKRIYCAVQRKGLTIGARARPGGRARTRASALLWPSRDKGRWKK